MVGFITGYMLCRKLGSFWFREWLLLTVDRQQKIFLETLALQFFCDNISNRETHKGRCPSG
jgi:hypothetical protein